MEICTSILLLLPLITAGVNIQGNNATNYVHFSSGEAAVDALTDNVVDDELPFTFHRALEATPIPTTEPSLPLEPTFSPTSAPTLPLCDIGHLNTFDSSVPTETVVSFFGMGDIPYKLEERYCLNEQLRNITISPSGPSFMIHIGDIKEGVGGTGCDADAFDDISEIFTHPSNALHYDPRDAFFVVGDNEWTDCNDRNEAWDMWMENFGPNSTYGFGTFSPGHGVTVERQWNDFRLPGVDRSENFAFLMNDVLFIGINLVGGPLMGDEDIRLAQNLKWIREKMEFYSEPEFNMKAAVIFAHASFNGKRRKHFGEDFVALIGSSYRHLPVMFFHGNGHDFCVTNIVEANNTKLVDVEVEDGDSAPPLLVSLLKNTETGEHRWSIDLRGGIYEKKCPKGDREVTWTSAPTIPPTTHSPTPLPTFLPSASPQPTGVSTTTSPSTPRPSSATSPPTSTPTNSSLADPTPEPSLVTTSQPPTTIPTLSTLEPTLAATSLPTVTLTPLPTLVPPPPPTPAPSPQLTLPPSSPPTSKPSLSTPPSTVIPTPSQTSQTEEPTPQPTVSATQPQTEEPTSPPTLSPTEAPTSNPTTLSTSPPTTEPTSPPTPLATEFPTPSPTSQVTTQIGADLPVLTYITKNVVGDLKLEVCQGDCDSKDDCKPGLKCWKRDLYDPVPGCSGLGKKNKDYCYDPNALGTIQAPPLEETPSPTFASIPQPTSAAPTSSPTSPPTSQPSATPTSLPTAPPTSEPTATPTSLPTASPTEPPTSQPTQNPTPLSTTAATTAQPTSQPTTQFPTHQPTASSTVPPSPQPTEENSTAQPTNSPTVASTPQSTGHPTETPVGPKELTFKVHDVEVGDDKLGVCEGDCDRKRDCQPGLLCFKRDGFDPVPGCSGKGRWNKDYCYDPNAPTSTPALPVPEEETTKEPTSIPELKFLYSDVPDGSPALGVCEGDCDGHGDCKAGLKCFKRNGFTAVPGCSGFGKKNKDYCYDPNAPIVEETAADENVFHLNNN